MYMRCNSAVNGTLINSNDELITKLWRLVCLYKAAVYCKRCAIYLRVQCMYIVGIGCYGKCVKCKYV